jgi:hypothetical protein
MKTIRLLQVAAMLAISSAAGASDHLYNLNGTLADSLGGPALVDHGGVLGATSYSFGPNQGLTMNVALGGVYTIDMVMTFDTHSGWQKIVDFSSLGSDIGMYTEGAQWNFFNVGGYTATPPDGAPARLTLTRDASELLTIYVNGSAIGSFVDSSGKADFGANPANFFIDDFATGQREAAAGNVDYIATFDRALTADEVKAGVSPVPEPSGSLMLGAGLGLLALLRRRLAKA